MSNYCNLTEISTEAKSLIIECEDRGDYTTAENLQAAVDVIETRVATRELVDAVIDVLDTDYPLDITGFEAAMARLINVLKKMLEKITIGGHAVNGLRILRSKPPSSNAPLQTVLVHSACGGVGLAALRVCQVVGCTVYATVGSDEKAEYLMKHFSLLRSHIFNSRDDSFAADLMRETGGRGADIVLNSLAGQLLHASWQCVASFGRMIELGKVDFSTNGVLGMAPFAQNRAFFGVDLLRLEEECPDLLKSLLHQVLEWYDSGKLVPVHPVKEFDAVHAMDGIRHMQKGTHIGKVLLKIPEDPSNLGDSVVSTDLSFPPAASYVLVGGLGGLGRAVSNWMVEHGARELVYLSRSAGESDEDKSFLNELAAQGCQAVCIRGSVTKIEDVQRAVSACSHPLRGVIQMSATLRDRTFAKMTPTEWKDCLAPKVQGTWNLHEALDGQGSSLDFFVVFGSLAGTCGSSGQANYAAANSFLESFVRYRRQRGLPCSALNLGPVEETGMVSRDEKLLQMFRATSCHLLSEQEVLDGLHLAISQSSSPVGASDGSAGGVVTIGLSTTNPNPAAESSVRTAGWTGDIRFAIYSNLASTTERQPQITDDKFRAFVQRIEANPSLLNEPQTEIVVRRELGRLMTSYLGDGAEMSDEEVAGIAIDSMMAIEVKDWVRGNMNMDIGMDQTSRARNVGELAAVTVERLREKYGVHSMNAVLV